MKYEKKYDEKNCDINLENVWSCGMKRCVDSSPLLVVQYHADSDDLQQTSRLFIGSHGGDFSAIDAVTGIFYVFTYMII
jgi:hypothetical protein